MQLLDDAVLLRLEKPERLTASKRLWIPDSAKREAYELYQGTVLAVGPGQFRKKDGKRNPMDVDVGDRILVYWSAMEMNLTEVFADGNEYRVVSEKSVQCTFER